jgi:hypothetical protein
VMMEWRGSSSGVEWAEEVLPVLQAVHRAYPRREPETGVTPAQVNQELGRSADDRRTGEVLYELVRTGYLVGGPTPLDSSRIGPLFVQLSEKGLQVTAGWPASSGEAAYGRLLTLLNQQIETTSSPEEHSRLERFRDEAVGVGRGVLVQVLGDAAGITMRGGFA